MSETALIVRDQVRVAFFAPGPTFPPTLVSSHQTAYRLQLSFSKPFSEIGDSSMHLILSYDRALANELFCHLDAAARSLLVANRPRQHDEPACMACPRIRTATFCKVIELSCLPIDLSTAESMQMVRRAAWARRNAEHPTSDLRLFLLTLSENAKRRSKRLRAHGA
jgi:hypothetical protein